MVKHVSAQSRGLDLPPAFDLEEGSHCAWEALRVSDQPPFDQLVGSSLGQVDAIIDHWKAGGHRTLSGWILHFGERILSFSNEGDESRVGLDLPRTGDHIMTSIEDIRSGEGAG